MMANTSTECLSSSSSSLIIIIVNVIYSYCSYYSHFPKDLFSLHFNVLMKFPSFSFNTLSP